MRRVDRSSQSPTQTWLETAEKLKHTSKPSWFSRHYRDKAVYDAFEKIFHRKCAYCEAIDNTLDVEHFRPKAGVAEEPLHDGYYWLAYEWTNLLPSCTACNKCLKDRGQGPGRGKSVQFPLRAGSPRAFLPTDKLEEEQRLLLNPCEDEPNEHLRLLPDGMLEPKTEMGQTSIDVYFLNQTTKVSRRKSNLDRLAIAHKLGDLETLRIVLSEDAEFSGLLCQHYSYLVGRHWQSHLSQLEGNQAQQPESRQ